MSYTKFRTVLASSDSDRRDSKRVQKVVLLSVLGVCALIVSLPTLWMLSSSFKSNTEIFALPPKIVGDTFSLDAYIAVLSDAQNLRFLFNSYFVAACVTVLTVGVSVMAAYALSRYRFGLSRPLMVSMIGTQAIPPIALVIPYFSLIVAIGLYDSYIGLILTHLVFTLPYAVVMMTAYFNTVPVELDESVRMDGGGPFRTLFQVIFPIAVPGVVAVAAYTFTISWNEYLFALTVTKTTEMLTVPVGLSMLIGQNSQNWDQLLGLSVLGSIPIMIVFAVFQKWFISGLASGAVKA